MNHQINSISLIIVIVILIIQGSWILNDSRKRGVPWFWLWGLLGFLSFPVPIIVYLIVYGHGKEKCNNCGKIIEKSSFICPYCGEKLKKTCPDCGFPVEEGWIYCPRCSGKL